MARARGNRMAKAWQGSFNTAAIGITTTQVNVLQSVESAGLNQTLLRSRGEILVQATPNAAADVGVIGLGLIVVHANAATAGGVSLPGPLTDVDADWLWHQFVPVDAIVLTTADANARSIVSRIEIDAKAMRRVAGDNVVVLIAQISAGTGMASSSCLAGVRFLLAHG